jgi:hypothetical protein
VPPAVAAYSVSIGPVSVPEIVDRPQFVRALLLRTWRRPWGDARVYTFSAEADYRVLVDIQRFESVRGAGEAPYNRTP